MIQQPNANKDILEYIYVEIYW